MIRGVIATLLSVIGFVSLAQPYGDEWIDYNKEYFRIGLAEDGIYRISYSDLLNAGFPVNTVDPRRIQLFYKGEEQAILVNGQGDAIFNTSDFIEFYGQKNDGSADARLYRPESFQPHQRYSLYSDSSAYFLSYHLTPLDGKRMETFSQNNTGGLPALSSHAEQRLNLDVSTYAPGIGYSTDNLTRLTYFDQGEGWTGSAIQENQSVDYTIDGLISSQPSDGLPEVEVLLVGRDDLPHVAEIFVGQNTASLRSLGTIQFDNFETTSFTSDFLWTDISASGTLAVRVTALGESGANDLLSVSYVNISFPQQYDMDGLTEKTFYINNQGTPNSYIEIQNTPAQTQLYDITDNNNVVRIGSNSTGSGINAMINNTNQERVLFANGPSFRSPTISKIKFRDINSSDHNYIIITNRLLMQPSGGTSNPIKSYADYRASSAGGGYDTLIVDIDMLYNQYNHGIKSPLAIYDFMRYMVDNGDPQYLFIIGKGLGPAVNFHRNANGVIIATQTNGTYEIRDLVPSAGTPGSDILFTAGLDGTTNEPAVPVGRLPARNGANVMSYLNKVITTESLPFDDLWRKNVLHLSGGISANELVIFRSFMDGFKAIAEDDHLGGDVETIAKTSASTSQLINVSDEVNKGLNLVTFYGHSAPSIIDIDIGFATDPLLGYNNQDRYPMFLINGCNAGEFFQANVVFGEDWVLAENKGAVGFIAHSSFGFPGNLRRYTDLFYEIGYGDSVFVSESIGQIQKEVAIRYSNISGSSPTNITQVQQMVLLGDPALKLFGPELPDYAISDNDIIIESFDDEPVTALADSFAVKVVVRNYGRTRNDSISLSLERQLSDNSTLIYDTLFSKVNYLDTLIINVKRGTENGFGNNSFSITIDSNATIPELDETNNVAQTNFFLPLFGTRNLFPVNYGIVNEQPARLLVQSSNILENERNFLFEIDTVNTFDSPFLKTNSINSKLLAEWNVDLLPNSLENDSTVYYWRTKFATVQSGESDDWVVSSFTYIQNGEEGWSQSDFAQFVENSIVGLEANQLDESFDFLRTQRNFEITTYGADNSATNVDVSVRIDGTEYIIDNQKRCRDNTINLIAFDKNDAVPYAAVPLIFQDNKTCGRQPQVINSFTISEIETGSEDLIEYIDNVSLGDSVAIFTIGDPQPQSWSVNVLAKLEEIGIASSTISSLQNGEPLIAFGRKGSPSGSAQEFKTTITPETEQQLQASVFFTGVQSNGVISSQIIGPASSWGILDLNQRTEAADDTRLDIYGLDINGNETLLASNVSSFPFDLSGFSAEFLKLVLIISDEVDLTPATLNKWLVTFIPRPEGIVIASSPDIDNSEVQEGELIEKSFGFLNISNQSYADSLIVRREVFNNDTRTQSIVDFKIQAPAPRDTTLFNIEIDSRNKVGSNNLIVNVNPRIESEIYYENNVLSLADYITVNADNTNPILDVLFDGRYIINGDIVSPSPLISIRLKDENPFIKTTDTTAVNVFIKRDCEVCNFERLSYSREEVNWFPADDNEDFRFEYKPANFEDGIYTLRIEAEDQRGNSSGEEPYLISFEVINESTITNFYPYPNPFSSSTRFVFTLTGSEIPNNLIIQILTVSGKVVREITQNEIGPVHIGNNITQYAWDGRDEFGDQLANGVYLYRVFVKQNGIELKKRNTSADKAFKNGFGKLYILR